jgi:hypothetical protein
MCTASGQIRCDDLTCSSIDGEVQLPPSPVPRRYLHMPDMNPESCTIDEQMDRSIRGKLTNLNLVELLKPPGHGRVIRDRKIQFEQLSQRPEEAFGLPERKMKDHTDRQRGRNGDVRIGTLAAGLAAGRGVPGVERVIREPVI